MLHIKISTLEGTKEFEISFKQLNSLLAELLDNRVKKIIVGRNEWIRKDQIIDIKVFEREDKNSRLTSDSGLYKQEIKTTRPVYCGNSLIECQCTEEEFKKHGCLA